MNNTIVGTATDSSVAGTGTGIRVRNNAAPTLLNNIVANLATGIDVDGSSQNTVLGGTLYYVNTADTQGIGRGDFAIQATATQPLFVNAAQGDYYPTQGSVAVDSAVNSLEDRPEMIRVRAPLGISPSPVLAPGYDASGQLRVDDPDVPPPPGVGSNVFKDRGALERADFEGPTAQLIYPQDNGPRTRIRASRWSTWHAPRWTTLRSNCSTPACRCTDRASTRPRFRPISSRSSRTTARWWRAWITTSTTAPRINSSA